MARAACRPAEGARRAGPRGRSVTTPRPPARHRRRVPVMVKAAMGGGGKGCGSSALPASCPRPPRGALGGERGLRRPAVYIERYVEEPRHIEVQVLGDGHATWSISASASARSSVAPEADRGEPSPFVDPDLRRRMGEAPAVSPPPSATSMRYGGVPRDGDRNFYFLEMNTRLQVEHPVTELVTGRPRQAAAQDRGREKLGFTQDDVAWNGWAIECRINAEDPYAGFIPSPGRIVSLRPASGPGCAMTRASTAVYIRALRHPDGQAHRVGERPRGRIACMTRALAEYKVVGVQRRSDPPAHHAGRGLRRRAALHPVPRAADGRGSPRGGRPPSYGRAHRRRLAAYDRAGSGPGAGAARPGRVAPGDVARLESPVKFEASWAERPFPSR